MFRPLYMTAVLLFSASPAFAQSLIDRADEAFNNGDFDGALRLLSDVDAVTVLTRADLVRALAKRAIVRHALGRQDGLLPDLRALACLEPEFSWPETAPDALLSPFSEAAREVRALDDGDGCLSAAFEGTDTELLGEIRRTRFTIDVISDAAALVRSTRIMTRVADGAWVTHPGPSAEVTIGPGLTVEYYGEVVGPGGAIIVAIGSAGNPRRSTVLTPEEAPQAEHPTLGRIVLAAPTTTRERVDHSPSRRGLWIGLGVGAAVIVGAVTTWLVLSSGAETRFRVPDPVFDLPPGP